VKPSIPPLRDRIGAEVSVGPPADRGGEVDDGAALLVRHEGESFLGYEKSPAQINGDGVPIFLPRTPRWVWAGS